MRAHHEKWYNLILKEEMEWEDKVEKEVLESTQLKEESSVLH